jgi:hypothetical protein
MQYFCEHWMLSEIHFRVGIDFETLSLKDSVLQLKIWYNFNLYYSKNPILRNFDLQFMRPIEMRFFFAGKHLFFNIKQLNKLQEFIHLFHCNFNIKNVMSQLRLDLSTSISSQIIHFCWMLKQKRKKRNSLIFFKYCAFSLKKF